MRVRVVKVIAAVIQAPKRQPQMTTTTYLNMSASHKSNRNSLKRQEKERNNKQNRSKTSMKKRNTNRYQSKGRFRGNQKPNLLKRFRVQKRNQFNKNPKRR
jgi:hypothetical protein